MLNLWAEEMQLHERRLIYAAEPHFSIPLMSPGHIWRPYRGGYTAMSRVQCIWGCLGLVYEST